MAKAPKKSERNKHDGRKNLFKLEEATIALTDRQKLFCMEYIACKFNGAEAARKAGYEANSAHVQASQFLSNPNIVQYIEILKKDLGLRMGITQERIAAEMAKIAFSDVKDLMTVDGGFKGIHELDNEKTASISSIEITDFEMLDGRIGKLNKIKLWDKQKALADLNKMLGYNAPEKQQITHDFDLSKEEVTFS